MQQLGENEMLKIELTEEQKALLEPLFQAVRDANAAGSTAAIGAQIWPDGMVVRLFDERKGKALSAVLGGNYNRMHVSAGCLIDADGVGA
ncbi:MAG: hypothetical protein CVU31_11645 [Betaproteobacteria bacterium HGW-Betaproteobacteria-4]|jgi:hypothetical protein|nr:MAG: hypothetical protein CVU31_11645 [Betaproteobacteria bacterium HGW-Betaproteobacteria-4]